MLKINVSGDIDNIKNKLLPIKNEVCIVHNRKNNDNYVVTFESNLDFIRNELLVKSIEAFTEEKRIESLMSDNDIVIAGRVDYIR